MWQKNENSIKKDFSFQDFNSSIRFVNQIAQIANKLNHHPKLTVNFNVVSVESTTHSAGDTLTDKDQELANLVDALVVGEEVKESEMQTKPMSIKEVKLYTDGGSRGNPGPSAIGFAVFDTEDNLVVKESKYLGITTNNQAEYQALKQGLELCQKNGYRKVSVFMDSLLVVNQMKGIYKVKNRDLWPIHESIKEFLSNFSDVNFTHIPRELNKLADSMVNECLDNRS